jgi:hypothetical protein
VVVRSQGLLDVVVSKSLEAAVRFGGGSKDRGQRQAARGKV